ncbi:uncharacterized protein F5Z01DRAFT_98842 [Emericellopsis atlantica]|uniref:Inner kinetochore subunit AME1 domain-containing protein n=1 Tax=Emericellopsis atlantica TaxID=2614577 RepID=A0A9P7ZNP6_9HYPO|nr:uncharacterized protein F5Z01DRAFT_98842 [Emericellopsis atlantica]KAG9254853.1 hypothetical protein F5Z01DRAFT_98842 [Emericellopsis atlantica]
MATGREARAERLNDRLRGAGRVNIEDESFNLDLGDFAIPLPPTEAALAPPQPEPTPPAPAPAQPTWEESPSERRRTESPPSHLVAQDDRARPARSRDPYNLPDTSGESISQANGDSTVVDAPSELPEPQSAELHESELRARSVSYAHNVASPTNESDLLALASSALATNERLREALRSDDGLPEPSSPLVAREKRSNIRKTLRQSRSKSPASLDESAREDHAETDRVQEQRGSPAVVENPDGQADEVTDPAADLLNLEPARSDPSVPPSEPNIASEAAAEASPEPHPEAEEEVVEELHTAQAPGATGRKRSRPSPPPRRLTQSPAVDEQEDVEVELELIAPARKRGRTKTSPAVQSQGVKAKSKPDSRAAKKAKPKTKPKARRRQDSQADDGNQIGIELTIQRLVNHKPRDGDDGQPDPLHLDIPHANRSDISRIEVFANVCSDTIAKAIEKFHRGIQRTSDPKQKKEFRIKIRALEAYSRSLKVDFMNQITQVNHQYSLQKRVRDAQKERLGLREEIIRLRKEREQVALRMDAVRIKHEDDSKEATYLLHTSSTMRDIDAAVAAGEMAPELPTKAKREAELANLELVIAQVADQACTSSAGGGMLSQIKEFNALLERAAGVLESR